MQSTSFKRVNWIFFDLDDTLWNFSDNSSISLRELYEISPILRKLFRSVEEFIDIYHRNNSLMWDLYSKGEISAKNLKIERWRRTLSTRQFEVLTAVCEELDTNYLDILAKGHEKFPGAEQMLERLTKRFLIAILSNGFSDTQYKKLRYSGLEKYITRTIVSEELGINKPDKRLFRYAIEETGASKPYLMVGDHAETDIMGAMKAGWHAVWFNPQRKLFPYSTNQLLEENILPGLLVADVDNFYDLEKSIVNFFDNR